MKQSIYYKIYLLNVYNLINLPFNKFVFYRSYSLTKEEMVLLTLLFYASGSMLTVIGDFIGVHKTTASRIIFKVSRAIATLAKRYINLPTDEDQLHQIEFGFYRIARFPNCVGALDCTHIKIQSPGGDDADSYQNSKGDFSVNVQCICDSSLQFTNVVCRCPGSIQDWTIFSQTKVKQQFENGEFANSILVGDSAYFVKPYLLTPLSDPTTAEEHLYNGSHIRTQKIIKKCFELWKRRFPILALGIRQKVDKIRATIVATAVLHNMACRNSDPPPPPLDADTEALIQEMYNFPTDEVSDNPTLEDNKTRLAIINHFSIL